MNKPAGGKVLYPELSYAITAIAYEVHNQLGPGFTEDICQNAIVCEVESRHIPHEQQGLSYLKAANLRLGILINFGGQRVEYHRIVN